MTEKKDKSKKLTKNKTETSGHCCCFFFLKEKKKKEKQKKQTNVFALNYLHMNIMETDYAHKKTK